MASPVYVTNFTAEVKCYHCSSVLGQLRSEDTTRQQPAYLTRWNQQGEQPIRRWQDLRCERCGGPVFLDEAGIVRRRIEQFEFDEDRPRRGRPPKRRPVSHAA